MLEVMAPRISSLLKEDEVKDEFRPTKLRRIEGSAQANRPSYLSDGFFDSLKARQMSNDCRYVFGETN